MLWVVEHLVRQSRLHHLAALHHHDAPGEQPCDGDVMGDERHGDAQPGDQGADEVEQPRLDGHVEPAGRLVHEHEARVGDEGAGDLQTLQHAAGELAGLCVQPVIGDFDLAQPVERGGADVAVMAGALGHQPLADIAAGGHAHAQRVARVLVDVAPVGAVQRAQGGRGHGMDVMRGAIRVAIDDGAAIRRDAAGQHVEQRGLAGARFADDGEHLAGPERGADLVECGDPAEAEAEIACVEDGCVRHAGRPVGAGGIGAGGRVAHRWRRIGGAGHSAASCSGRRCSQKSVSEQTNILAPWLSVTTSSR